MKSLISDPWDSLPRAHRPRGVHGGTMGIAMARSRGCIQHARLVASRTGIFCTCHGAKRDLAHGTPCDQAS